MPKNFTVISETRKNQSLEFIEHYLACFNATEAARRMGYAGTSASTQGHELLHLPFTKGELKKRYDQHAEDNKEIRQQVILMLMRESNDFSDSASHRARVAAIAQLSKILGMEQINLKADVSHRGGVMLVPMVNSLDEWQKAAQVSQAALMADAVNI